MKRVRVMLLALTLAFSLAPTSGALANPVRQGASVVDGAARFQIITPTLIRMEYAADGRFEDRPTFNAVARGLTPPPFSVRTMRSGLEIRTARLVLRYTHDSSPLGPGNVSVWVGGRTVRPAFGSPARSDALGGWYRGLDYYPGQAGPVDQIKLHQGLLTAAGLVPARRLHDGAAHRGRLGPAATGPWRRLRGRLLLRLRDRLQDGAEGPRHAHRPPRAAAEVGVRQLVLEVLRVLVRRLPDPAAARVPREPRAARRPGRRHRLEGAQHVGRVELEPGAVPEPAGLPGLGQGGASADDAQRPRGRSPRTTRATRTRRRSRAASSRPRRRASRRSRTASTGPIATRPPRGNGCTTRSRPRASASGGWTTAATTAP